jgi:hypothetical protein
MMMMMMDVEWRMENTKTSTIPNRHHLGQNLGTAKKDFFSLIPLSRQQANSLIDSKLT